MMLPYDEQYLYFIAVLEIENMHKTRSHYLQKSERGRKQKDSEPHSTQAERSHSCFIQDCTCLRPLLWCMCRLQAFSDGKKNYMVSGTRNTPFL